MGWFEKQIKQRSDLDQQLFEESFFRVAGVVLGERTATKISDEHIITKQAIDDILKYYHFKPVEIPKTIKEHVEQYINGGMDRKSAMKQAAKDRGVSKRDIYNELLKEE